MQLLSRDVERKGQQQQQKKTREELMHVMVLF